MLVLDKIWTIYMETHVLTRKEFISYDAFIYGFGHIPWKFDFVVRLVLLVSQCYLLGIKSLLVCIEISPGFLEELPDGDEPA